MITQITQVRQVAHEYGGDAHGDPADPAAFGPALAVAYALHSPAPRAPEVVTVPAEARARARRNTAARIHRRTVRG